MKREEVIKKANEVLRNYNLLNELPINLKVILEKNNISLYEDDFKCILEDGNVKGVITKKKDNVDIWIDKDEDIENKKFTVAHELGHFFLHFEEDERATIIDYRTSFNKGSKEEEADIFAQELLMPETILIKEHAKLAIPMLSELSEKFGVSKEEMKKRIDYIGLICYG